MCHSANCSQLTQKVHPMRRSGRREPEPDDHLYMTERPRNKATETVQLIVTVRAAAITESGHHVVYVGSS